MSAKRPNISLSFSSAQVALRKMIGEMPFDELRRNAYATLGEHICRYKPSVDMIVTLRKETTLFLLLASFATSRPFDDVLSCYNDAARDGFLHISDWCNGLCYLISSAKKQGQIDRVHYSINKFRNAVNKDKHLSAHDRAELKKTVQKQIESLESE